MYELCLADKELRVIVVNHLSKFTGNCKSSTTSTQTQACFLIQPQRLLHSSLGVLWAQMAKGLQDKEEVGPENIPEHG